MRSRGRAPGEPQCAWEEADGAEESPRTRLRTVSERATPKGCVYFLPVILLGKRALHPMTSVLTGQTGKSCNPQGRDQRPGNGNVP